MADIDLDNIPEEDNSPLVRQLAKQLKAANRELNTYRTREAKAAFAAVGFPEDHPQLEVLKKMHGDKPLTVEDLKATAQQYQLAPATPGAATPAAGQAPSAPQLTPEQQERVDSTQAANAVAQLSTTPGGPQPINERIAEAEKAGNWDLVDQLNAEKLAAALTS